MASNENTPSNDTINKENIPVSDASNEDISSTGREGSFLASLMEPLTIRIGNLFRSTPVRVQESSGVIRSSEEEPPSSSQSSKPDEDPPLSPQNSSLDEEKSPSSSQNNKPAEQEPTLSFQNSELEEEKPDQNDQSGQSDEEQSEVESVAGGSDEDDYEFSYEEDDDDVPIDNDPFFGFHGDTSSKPKPGQPTEEQLEAISKALEDDANAEAIKQALTGIPPLVLDVPDLITHPLLKAQNHNATDMLITVRSSFGGDVHHVVALTEPLLSMKMNFVEAVKLPVEQLSSLEFFYGYHVIKDDDTAEKVCNPCSNAVRKSLTML
jgi:hypothetical protein